MAVNQRTQTGILQPIVGNGDIITPEDAKSMMDETGCDFVMVGRGAMGNPFLFEQINDYLKTGSYAEYSFKDKLDAFLIIFTL